MSRRFFAPHTVALGLAFTGLPALAAGYKQKASSWWGDPAVPAPNHVEMTIEGVRPDATVSGNISFTMTCTLPQPSTLQVDTVVIQVDGNNVQAYYGSNARAILGQARTFTVDTRGFSDGWHELRARCYAFETTAGPDLGKQTQVTNGHQLFFKNGNSSAGGGDPLVAPGIVDAHSWYDTDAVTGDAIDYVYVQILNMHPLIEAPLKDTVPFTGRVTHAGPTTIGHWALKVDGVALAEFHDATQLRTINLDTTMLSNGPHILQFHGHGLARSGKQLAGQVEIPIVVQNDLQAPEPDAGIPAPDAGTPAPDAGTPEPDAGPSADAGVADDSPAIPTPPPATTPPVHTSSLSGTGGCSSRGTGPLAALGAMLAALAFIARARRRQTPRR
jgi:hypothetical protein